MYIYVIYVYSKADAGISFHTLQVTERKLYMEHNQFEKCMKCILRTTNTQKTTKFRKTKEQQRIYSFSIGPHLAE